MFISRGDKNTWNEGIIHFQDFYTIFWILLFVFTQFHEFFPTKSRHKKFLVELHEFLHYFADLSSPCLLILVCRYTFSSSTIVVRKSANIKKRKIGFYRAFWTFSLRFHKEKIIILWDINLSDSIVFFRKYEVITRKIILN